jgi:pseudaminic acid synthase
VTTNTVIEIGGRKIGDGHPTFIVAELSANHGHDIKRAVRTIEAAADAGADAIKLQTYTPDTLTLKSSAEPFIVKTKNAWAGRTLHDLYAEAMTPWEWHAELQEVARRCGLVFFSTPFDATAVEYLEALSVPCHKIASFELTDLPLVEHVAARGRPMIMSTGMATLGEIEAAVQACRDVGNNQLALLRCVSSYPARPASMHLSSLKTLASFGTVVGLSDHTRDATVAIAAVTLGARLVEKHFILQRSDGGPDSFFSIEPHELKQMVSAIRDVEKAVGEPRFGPEEEEKVSLTFRRSLFVARPVEAGAVLTCDDIRCVRPSHGLDPRALPQVLGRTSATALSPGTPLTWDGVGPAADRPRVRLRPATPADSERLLAWRNDPVTVTTSWSSRPVEPAEHRKWLGEILASASSLLMIASDEMGAPIGQIRLDADVNPGTFVVSIAIAPEARGRRLASAVLQELEAHARARGAARLIASIRADNDRSVRAFKAAGYYQFIQRKRDSANEIRCERRITPFT